MFKTIMTPVDLSHEGDLEKALNCTADLAKHHGAEVIYVGVTATSPSAVAHTPEEFGKKLDAFAAGQADKHGITARAETITSHDPTIDVDQKLIDAGKSTGADLIVMASHVLNAMDYVWPSNGGSVAEHAPCSVMVVRS